MDQKSFDPTGQDLIDELGLDLVDEEGLTEQVPMQPDLDNPMLDGLTEEEKEVAQKVLEKQAQTDPIMEGFRALQDKPSDAQIEEWKKQFGKVYTIGLNEDEYFLFRPLRRLEWRNLLKALAKQTDEMKKKEAICQRAVLWPTMSPDSMSRLPAGTPDTLYEMVLQASNFLVPQEALACVRKL
jgi:hypothetical protein